jgi:CheY-like chemotaxis protein
MKGHGTKIIKLVSTSGKNTTEQASEGRIGKICYVDDSRTSAYVTKKILKEYGYEVDFFPSAEPAVVAILEKDYDLLLTDLTLSTGGMDGDELVRFLRNSGHPRKKLLPVIVITGTSNKETLLKIYEAGANGVLVKPITGEELHDRIRTLVPEKAFPGTADGYALEIPHSLSHPGKPQATEVPVTSPEEVETNAVEEEINHLEAEIDEAAIIDEAVTDGKRDSLLTALGILTEDEKAETAPPVIKTGKLKVSGY